MKNMNTLKQDLKGRAQQVVGAVDKNMGNPVRGTMTQIKGKTNVVIAKIKTRLPNSK